MTKPSGSVGAGRRLGVDVGGTKCLGVVIDADDRVVVDLQCPTPRGVGSSDRLIDQLAELVASLTAAAGEVDSVGIGLPGLVTRDGVLRAAPNLDEIDDLPARMLLEQRLGRPVHVDNDATCATIAEWQVGAGRGVDDLILITLGTGIGGGLVSAGALHRGANGFAGEFGHMTVDPNGPACPCGRRGCWERFASGTGLVHLASGIEIAGGVPTRGEQIVNAASDGNVAAQSVIDEVARWTAIGLAGLINAFDPSVVLIGGGFGAALPTFIPSVERHLHEVIYQPEQRDLPVVKAAALGAQAGSIGAALLADAVNR